MTKSNDYMNAYMKKRYVQRRDLAFQILGGVCLNCGRSDNLEIDHVDREGVPYRKKFGKFWNMALVRFIEELTKCQLLCDTCHLLKTADDLGVVHGGGVSGKKNCKCDLCRNKKADYMRAYRRR